VFLFVTIFINLFFVLTKGVKNMVTIPYPMGAWIAAVAGVGVALLSIVVGFPFLRKKAQEVDEQGNVLSDLEKVAKDGEFDEGSWQKSIADKLKPKEVDPEDKSWGAKMTRVRNAALKGLSVDIHEDVNHTTEIAEMHANAEKFDPRTEQIFKYLQVMSACAVSFSHGANDVANSIGSFTATLATYQTGQVPGKNVPVQIWVLVLGATGIVIGLVSGSTGWAGVQRVAAAELGGCQCFQVPPAGTQFVAEYSTGCSRLTSPQSCWTFTNPHLQHTCSLHTMQALLSP
jgi:sodium-dependent phosphate transporter